MISTMSNDVQLTIGVGDDAHRQLWPWAPQADG